MITFKEYITELNTSSEEIDALEDKIRTEVGLEKFWLYSSNLHPNVVGLQLIVVSKENHGGGRGTKAMQMLCDYADKHRLTIVLSPSERNARTGTTSKTRLIDFYSRFGFIKNTGKNKDPRFTATMYRTPK